MDVTKVCRLCLNVIFDNYFERVESDISQMLEDLLLKVNLGISRNPIICNQCSISLQECYHFKLKCLQPENMIRDFRDTKEAAAMVDVREVCFHSQRDESDASDKEMCRFCMNVTKCELLQLCDTKENFFMVSMLQKYIPDLYLNITEELITCKSCFDTLQCFYGFITMCIDAEEKIMKYVVTEGTNTEGQIELNTIAKLMCNNDTLREIDVSGDCEEDDSKYIKIKCEDVSGDIETDFSIIPEVLDVQTDVTVHDSQDPAATREDDVPMYECQERRFKSKYRRSRVNHRMCHQSEVEVYECDACSFTTKFKSSLNRHSLTHKNPAKMSIFRCHQCSFSTRFIKNLRRHKVTHNIVKHKCNLCSYETKYKCDLKSHAIRYHSSTTRMFKCTVCSYAAFFKHYLTKHMLVHKSLSEVTIYKCMEPECRYSTRYKDALQKHGILHKNPAEVTMFKCESCPYQAKRLSCLKRHLISHKSPAEVTLFQCDKCAYTTRHKQEFSRHSKIHPDPSEVMVYNCENCPYVTRHKRGLIGHVRTKCEAKISTKYTDALQNHENPAEVTMFKCGSCPYQTKRRSCLKRHLISHKSPSEVTLFQCDKCAYKTRHKQEFSRHIKIHPDPSEVTVYNCEKCPYVTRYKRNLVGHVRTKCKAKTGQ